ncbi:MAG: CotH kinase family protein, partial [bacterium]
MKVRSHTMFGGICLLVVAACLLTAVANGGQIVINEFLAVNNNGRVDKYGATSDWIELYNQTASPIDLGGWYLTDDATRLAKWRFPSTNISAYGYVVIVADGSTGSVYKGELHTTNFSLSGSGEYLGLVWTNGLTIVDQYSPVFPSQSDDVSYGILADRITRGYFTTPTPGTTNTTQGCTGIATPPQFSRGSCVFTNSFVLSISNTAGVINRYTTDGTLPSELSQAYTGSITIATTTRIRARAYEALMVPSPVVTCAYYLLGPGLENFSSDLPIVIIENFGAGDPGSSSANRQTAQMSVFEPVGGRTHLTNAPGLDTRVGINKHGSSTLGQAKWNIRVEVYDEDNLDKSVKLLGMPKESDWLLWASPPDGFDRTYMRNSFTYELSNQAGRYAVRNKFCEVFVDSDGASLSSSDYFGVYSFMEMPKVGNNRINISKLEVWDTAEPDVTGGYVLKIDRADDGDSGINRWGVPSCYHTPSETEMETTFAAQNTWLLSYMDQFYTVLNSAGFTNPVTGYQKYLDSASWIDHSMLNILTKNPDALRLSTFLYKNRNGKVEFGPVWDFDRTMGCDNDGRASNPVGWDADTPSFTYPWWDRVFRDPDFWQQFIDRWQSLRKSVFSTTNMNFLIVSMSNQLAEAQVRDYTRWYPGGLGTWAGKVVYLNQWLSNRVAWIDSQFIAAPQFGTNSGQIPLGYSLSMTCPDGTTNYYTLDGTDPRASGGGIGPAALAYSGPITLTGNTVVRARARDGSAWQISSGANVSPHTPWGGIAETTFIVFVPSLKVTEVMYNPRTPTPGTAETNYTASDFEFVEVANLSALPVSLTGVQLTDGIIFNFSHGSVKTLAPGEYALAVKNLAAFMSRYPGWAGMKIAGEFSDNLANSGEKVTLSVPCINLELASFTYSDGRGWPVAADGAGHSLVPLLFDSQTNGVLDYGGNWRASAYRDGSPGRQDPEPVRDVTVNEFMAHSDYTNGAIWQDSNDWIELYNSLLSGVCFSNWYLSDDSADLK